MRDEAGFSRYVHGGAARHLRTAYLLSGSAADADDLLQVALAKLMGVWDRVSTKGNPDGYLRTVMVNAHTSRARRSWRREIATERLPERVHNPYEDSDKRLSLLAALRGLTPGERAAVVLRHVEDLSEREAARVLGCSIGTVKSQTSRGLAKLRTALGTSDSWEGVRK